MIQTCTFLETELQNQYTNFKYNIQRGARIDNTAKNGLCHKLILQNGIAIVNRNTFIYVNGAEFNMNTYVGILEIRLKTLQGDYTYIKKIGTNIIIQPSTT